MSKFDEVITECKRQMETRGIDCDEALLTAIAKSLGPSVYDKDGRLVAAGDKGEVQSIMTRFVAGKLGVDGEAADRAFAAAVEKIGASNRQKLRPVFYYLLVKELGKESVFA